MPPRTGNQNNVYQKSSVESAHDMALSSYQNKGDEMNLTTQTNSKNNDSKTLGEQSKKRTTSADRNKDEKYLHDSFQNNNNQKTFGEPCKKIMTQVGYNHGDEKNLAEQVIKQLLLEPIEKNSFVNLKGVQYPANEYLQLLTIIYEKLKCIVSQVDTNQPVELCVISGSGRKHSYLQMEDENNRLENEIAYKIKIITDSEIIDQYFLRNNHLYLVEPIKDQPITEDSLEGVILSSYHNHPLKKFQWNHYYMCNECPFDEFQPPVYGESFDCFKCRYQLCKDCMEKSNLMRTHIQKPKYENGINQVTSHFNDQQNNIFYNNQY